MDIPEKEEIDKELELLIDLSIALAGLWFLLSFLPPQSFWIITVAMSVAWFSWEAKNNWENKRAVKKALIIGLLLVVINLWVNQYGAAENIYYIASNKSLLFIYRNPVELLLLSFFGSAAWFLRLGERANLLKSVFDVLILSVMGSATERFILRPYGLMNYVNVAWYDPLFTYVIAWSALHIIYYMALDTIVDELEVTYVGFTQYL